ncbi:hypothetical protein BX600DRAFT_110680 [Xylariales sp. PMI_506]|nr:hypothetical protein BX600DRAFT_110680 [Xylariales sp. PMI_506]
MRISLAFILVSLASLVSSQETTFASTITQTSTITSSASSSSSSSTSISTSATTAATPSSSARVYSTCTDPTYALKILDLSSSFAEATGSDATSAAPLIPADWTAGCAASLAVLAAGDDADWPTSFQPTSFWAFVSNENCALELRLGAPVALSRAHVVSIMTLGLGIGQRQGSSTATAALATYGMMVCSGVVEGGGDDDNGGGVSGGQGGAGNRTATTPVAAAEALVDVEWRMRPLLLNGTSTS